MKGWKLFFWMVAGYSWAIGIPLYIAPGFMTDLVGHGVFAPDLSLMKITGALIVCIGILFAIVAHDPIRFRQLLWAPLIGKLGLGLVYIGDWFLGAIPQPAILMTLVDIPLTVIVLFFVFRRPLKSQLDAYALAA
ncbi:MAG: hypothetical protein R3C13_04925 [Hyphomonas sp.]|uniref:hypothetical protein n=1 Tax=Hyphomonas sp. TaxID=87 RepID=UPI0035291153